MVYLTSEFNHTSSVKFVILLVFVVETESIYISLFSFSIFPILSLALYFSFSLSSLLSVLKLYHSKALKSFVDLYHFLGHPLFQYLYVNCYISLNYLGFNLNSVMQAE